jgi:DNA-binding NtrC family response regulator
MSGRILLIDDDPAILSALSRYLTSLDYDVLQEDSGHDGIERFLTERPDLVILDLDLPDMTGIDVLSRIREERAVVIMLTGSGDIETAVRAMQLGAENFLSKPIELPHLGAVVARAIEKSRLRRENVALRAASGHEEPGRLEALGASPMMAEIGRQVSLLAQSDSSTVLLTGESGTGKGWVSRLIHRMSRRAPRPFVEVNCAGLTSTFLADELFGHERGAFTDAREPREGLFEAAHTGSLFLDEVGDMSLDLQPQLLKVLEEKKFRRLGSAREISVDVRLIAATNRNLPEAVKEGSFREDLYYRLNVTPIYLPPVRERPPEDRASLIHRLHGEIRTAMGRPEQEISDDALQRLVDYEWPGNIREMRNVIERAVIFSPDSDTIYRDHLPIELQRERMRKAGRGFRAESLQIVERRHIERMLRHHQGNRTHAAKDLGISRATLINKIKTYELEL